MIVGVGVVVKLFVHLFFATIPNLFYLVVFCQLRLGKRLVAVEVFVVVKAAFPIVEFVDSLMVRKASRELLPLSS